ncbi:uncharacterized protein LOC126266919 [Schistocerca gregaria]|uniref:uncharacterized protein LOC126266919 n=1 Tax=Schistocerca gregaria TaxID=7010 RepID=UPI00211EBF11|nr:uncharacterized protein LOC126266919 [Schistocerca gregaria]
MIRKDLRVSGTYLLCNGNRIHKFRIKWRSKSTPTMEQRREVMRVTEDIVKTNNLPERITTGQLKITTKISFWSPRSKALSLRQFRSEKQGHLSAHKHSYVLRVSLADSKEQQDCQHVHTFSFMHSEVGWKNELQPFHPEKKVVETDASGINFVQMNGIQLHTKDAGATMHDGKHMHQNQANTKESVEVIVDRYDGEQHFARTNETEHDFVSRIEKLEKLVERACMAAKVHQNQAMIVGYNKEQGASEVAAASMKTEIINSSRATSPTIKLHHDLEYEPKEIGSSVNAGENYSFPIIDAGTHCQNETILTHDKYVKHPSSTNKLAAAHLQVVTTHWKFGNIKVSTNRDLDTFDISKAVIHRQCSACNIHVHKVPVDYKEKNAVAKPQACELPLTVSSYSALTHDTCTVRQNYKLPDKMNVCSKITADVAIKRKRRHNQNESEICELPNKKRVTSAGIAPVILGPPSFQEFSPYHEGVMSVFNALKTFQNILGGAECRNKVESNLTDLGENLENWLMYQSSLSRLRAVPRVNSDKKLREIRRYIIRYLRNRNANMAFSHQNEKLLCSSPDLRICDTHSEHHTKRALIMRSEENEIIMQDLSKESWRSTLGKIGGRCYKNSSAVQLKSESHVCSSGSQQTCVSSQSQELRAFNSTVSIKQQTVEENNSLQDNLQKSKMCESAVEHIGETESSNVQNVKVGWIDNRNYQPLDAENAEKLRYMVKGNNGMYKCTATNENLLKDKEKYEVETNGVVHILSFGDDFSGIVKPRCSSMEEELHLGRVQRPVQVHYDEICIPSVSYYRSPQFSAMNSVKQKENIGCSSGPVLFERDNALDTASGSHSHVQINSELKVAQHSLAKPITSKTADVSPKEVLLNAAMKLASLKELQTIPSIRALRTTLIQQGVDKAIEQTKLSSSVYSECYISTCSQDFSLHEIPLKSRSRTVTTASDSCNTLDRFEDCSNSSTTGSLTESYSPVFEGSAKNDCNNVNRSQNCRPQSFHRKMSSEKIVPPDPVVPSAHSKTYVIANPVRVNVGKLLSCSKIQVFFTTELYVNADCLSRLTDCKLHNMSPNSQASSNGEGDLIKSFLQLMAFNAAQKSCSSFSNLPSMANQSLRFKISEKDKLHATSPSECVVNSNKMTLSHAYNFLKCTCLSTETTESTSSTFSHCKCPPSVKFQGVSASYTVMSSQAKRITPRRQLIDIIHNIKSDVKDRSSICDRQHCFYFHVDEEESVEGFYSTVEKYCSALSKFRSHQYTSSRSIEILLRDIWLPGHKHSISFYVNLPLQKCKCSYCGLDTTVELCLNCGELFERTELGNYVPFDNQKTPEHVNMKMETSDAAVEVLNLVNNLYLCKPVVVVQQTDASVCKQNKTSGRIRKKTKHLCCAV